MGKNTYAQTQAELPQLALLANMYNQIQPRQNPMINNLRKQNITNMQNLPINMPSMPPSIKNEGNIQNLNNQDNISKYILFIYSLKYTES